MKIVYVAASPVPSIAANSVHVVKMAQAFVNGGHDVTLISPSRNEKEYLESVNADLVNTYGVKGGFIHTVSKVPQFKGGILLHAIKSAILARKQKADVYFCRCFVSAWVGVHFGLNTIFERHDSLKGFGNQSARYFIFRDMIKSKNLRKIIVITSALKAHFMEEFDLDPNKIIVAADGADDIDDDILPLDNLKKINRISVGYIGHLYEGRGIDIIIATARLLPEIDFNIVGGRPEDVVYWKDQANNVHNITFHGHVSHKDTKRFLKSFDFLLAPYQSKVIVNDGGDTAKWMSPLKVFEYMSAGRPILCSDIPVLREVLQHRENAMLCVPDLPSSWADNIKELIANKKLANKLSMNALGDFKAKYTWYGRAKNILGSSFINN